METVEATPPAAPTTPGDGPQAPAPHLSSAVTPPHPEDPSGVGPRPRRHRTVAPWVPARVLVTPAALEHAHGRAMVERAEAAGVREVVRLKANRLTGLRGADERETYRLAKQTLAVVVAPPSALRLQPIPPSADWRLDLAAGCPAHCQYCYLAGSLQGPPVTRAYANIDDVVAQVDPHTGRGTITSVDPLRADEGTTFEASCYTDPLGIEHLTGSLAVLVEQFAGRPDASLRFTTKFAHVDGLLALDHRRRTRVRMSVAPPAVEKFEGGTSSVDDRLVALGRLARAGYRVGLTVAPVMPVDDWPAQYARLLDDAGAALEGADDLDLTVELITHRFTPGSREVQLGWYPATKLDLDPANRSQKRTKFGSVKYVYRKPVHDELRAWFEREVAERLPAARVLYWT